MSSCAAVANRRARRLAIGAQLGKLPHKGLKSKTYYPRIRVYPRSSAAKKPVFAQLLASRLRRPGRLLPSRRRGF
jgi:hypothetical protein